ncbi:MAG: carboxy terminal-processing peptidase [Bacteroidetes bacterium]|nr:carboxy terminal-processing peptidase [Bacteroidota bacterium]
MKVLIAGIFGVLLYFGISTGQPYLSILSDSDTTLIVPLEKHKKEALVVTSLLSQHHYRKTNLNDSLSSVIFDDFFESLDYNKAYFLKSDIEYFAKYRTQLDDYLKEGNVDVPFQIFRIYRERLYERINKILSLLETEIDFTLDEYYDLDREDADWAENRNELDEVWFKIIKSQALSLKLGGKDWEGIQETLIKRYERYEKTISKYSSDDVFQIFMNSFSETFDPHTNYFSPRSSEEFKITMSLSLEGIGARLNNPNDYITIVEIIPGGPAYKSKKLYKDDRIIGVAQENDKEFTDVFGWRTEDAVQLIRGAKGTMVKLQILPHDAPVSSEPSIVALVRDKIKLEEQSAKKEVIPISKNNQLYKLGVILVPSFYIDFEAANAGDSDYRSTTRDVRKLVEELKDEGVDGIMIDLRYNGGGSLQEASELTGLFIPNGPVVQVRNSNGRIDVQRDNDRSVTYDGPLAVMVNRFSASASEIFAGAIQDYKRGVIIGETTYGKGSVQQLVNLDQFLPDEDDLGQLKLTLAKYYRITGSSTQNVGVVPDIEFPSFVNLEKYRERSLPSALPWDQIKPTYFNGSNYVSTEIIDNLKRLFADRLASDEELKEYINELKEIQEIRNRSQVSLNYEKRKIELDEFEQKMNHEKIDLSEEIDNSDIPEEGEAGNTFKNDKFLKEGLYLLAELAKEKLEQ